MPMPRKSLSEHDLTGTKPQYVLPDISTAPGRPKYPKGISPEAKRFFKTICRQLERRGNLTEGDQELIRLAAILRDRHARAIEHINSEGEVCTYTKCDKTGAQFESVQPNMWLKIAQESEKQIVSILDRCGLTPLNRAKVAPAEPPKTQTTSPEDEALLSRDAAKPPVEEEIDLNSIDLSGIQ
jgi:P27 family predicted phage terminase small subunit